MHTLPNPIQAPQTITELLPNPKIIELLREAILHFHSEEERSSSEFDEGLREIFTESFGHAVDKFSERLKEREISECIIIDVSGEMNSDFLDMVMGWVNPPRKRREEFSQELCLCLQEQLSQGTIHVNVTNIHKKDTQIILSLQDISSEKES